MSSRYGVSTRAKSDKPVKPVRSESRLRRFLRVYFTRHLQAALLSLGQMTETPFTTFLVCVVLGIALALPTSLYVLLKNVTPLSAYWETSSPVVLYLKTELTESQVMAVAGKIRSSAGVANVAYTSPQQGLAELQQRSDLGMALTVLKDNPLPAVLTITPKTNWQTPQAEASLLNAFKALPEVDMAKLDLDWIKRLSVLLNLGEKIVDALAILLSVGVIFVIGSTIRLVMASHHEEIEIYKLIGASDSFIRRPFLYRGIWYGLIGSLLAWAIVTVLIMVLKQPVADLAALYSSNYALQGLNLTDGGSLLLLGVLLGWIGAWIVVCRRTRRFAEVWEL